MVHHREIWEVALSLRHRTSVPSPGCRWLKRLSWRRQISSCAWSSPPWHGRPRQVFHASCAAHCGGIMDGEQQQCSGATPQCDLTSTPDCQIPSSGSVSCRNSLPMVVTEQTEGSRKGNGGDGRDERVKRAGRPQPAAPPAAAGAADRPSPLSTCSAT